MAAIEYRPIAVASTYLVGSDGSIRATKPKRTLKPTQTVCITTNNSGRHRFRVARLVAETFISPSPTNSSIVWHKNGNLDDNSATNLMWAEPSDLHRLAVNAGKAPRKRKTSVAVSDPDGSNTRIFSSVEEAARVYNKSPVTIGDYCSGRTRDSSGLQWSFPCTSKIILVYHKDQEGRYQQVRSFQTLDSACDYFHPPLTKIRLHALCSSGKITRGMKQVVPANEIWTYHRVDRDPVLDQPDEIWKFVPGYAELYQVSNLGRMRSLQSRVPFIMKVNTTWSAYPSVMLHKPDGTAKSHHVHRLVSNAFNVPQSTTSGKTVAHHINECKQDNHQDNLCVTSQQYNIEDAIGVPVARLSRTGDIVDVFPSITAAGLSAKLAAWQIQKACELGDALNDYFYQYMDDLEHTKLTEFYKLHPSIKPIQLMQEKRKRKGRSEREDKHKKQRTDGS